MRRLSNRDGQIAMVDAVMFMTIMLVACAVVVGSTGFWTSATDGRAALQQYTSDFTDTLLAVELRNLEYLDGQGEAVSTGTAGRCIGQLLCDEALMLENETAQYDFAGYEAAILRAARSLIRPGLDCALSCDGTSVFVGAVEDATGLPADRCASQMTVLPGGGTGTALTISIYVWVV